MTSMSSVGPGTKTDRAAYMISAARSDHGGTFDPSTGKRVTFTGGYMVGYGTVFGEAYVMPLSETHSHESRAIVAWLAHAILESSAQGFFYVGAWENGDSLVWEISRHIIGREAAIALGTQMGEYSIWDFENGVEIVL